MTTAADCRHALEGIDARLAAYRAALDTVDDPATLDAVRDQLTADIDAAGKLADAYAAEVADAADRRTRRRIVRAVRRYQRARLRAGTPEQAGLALELIDRVDAITAATGTSHGRCRAHTTPNSSTRPVMADNAAAHAPPRNGEHLMTCTSPP